MTSGIIRNPAGWVIGPNVTGITIDSRAVRPGYVFVAITGSAFDGHHFIGEAVGRGAVAVVGERPLAEPLDVPYWQVPSSREAAAELSAAFFGYPSRALTTIGVTGTNGKTSVVFWLSHLLRAANRRTGLISSVHNDTGARRIEASLTTPESPDLQTYLAEMRDGGLSHAVIEVSSHGIVQHRVSSIDFAMAILTNITREHLDFHGTMTHYMNAKAQLFHRLAKDSLGAVLNAEDEYFEAVRRGISAPVTSYGLRQGTVRGTIVREEPWYTEVEIRHPAFRISTRLNHPGRYNVYNLLAVVTAGALLGLSPDWMAGEIPSLPSVPGRMQVVGGEPGPMVIVDYAHTPDGLAQSLETVRKFSEGRVWLIFGARGGRDHGKRPEMGRIAAEGADRIVLTSDSPYFEDPAAIAEALAEGIRSVDAAKLERVELDRERAIRDAVCQAGDQDIVLITGRGPEPYQYFGAKKVALLDAEVVKSALYERNQREGFHVSGLS